MPFHFEQGSLTGLKRITPEEFQDDRGSLIVTYLKEAFKEANIEPEFIQNKVSHSSERVLRGLHYQKEGHSQAKIVRCTRGVIFDVVVDLRKNSPTYGQCAENVLSEYNNRMLYIPKGFAHGFAVLSGEASVHYKLDAPYNPQEEAGIRWDDPELDISWPIDEPNLSEKDRQLPTFKEGQKQGNHFSE